MKDLHHSCQGFSHIADNKPCQDASLSLVEGDFAIAIVSDGHGGERYFRSDTGSRLATETARDCVKEFVENVDAEIFRTDTIVNWPKEGKSPAAHELMVQLFKSIIAQWRKRIEADEKEHPLPQQQKDGNELAKIYGCTLMCCACTKDFWFAFHIGDGKCIAFDNEGQYSEPIPWDERCFLNKTTSLCDSDAINEFRYCYGDATTRPAAIFLGSDGIDDSFGDTENGNMVSFYIQILKLLVDEPAENVLQELKEDLPKLSKIGSKDDMSIAFIYDESNLFDLSKRLIQWQIQDTDKKIAAVKKKIEEKNRAKAALEDVKSTSEQAAIELGYAKSDLKRLNDEKESLQKKRARFSDDYKTVDLGLSVKWSMLNEGAENPYEFGKTYSWNEAKDLANDNWRLPTEEEFSELIDNCDWERNPSGFTGKSRKNGHHIFLPYAANIEGYGEYWSSTPVDKDAKLCRFCRDDNAPRTTWGHIEIGRSVRAVKVGN